jgi:hypothetical protein
MSRDSLHLVTGTQSTRSSGPYDEAEVGLAACAEYADLTS